MNLQTSFGGFDSIEEYLKYLWWTMHHSDDPNLQAFAVTCYLDESGTHDSSPYTVVAGLILNRHNFISLGIEWQRLLCEMRIKSPIHMKEFGRPHGELGYLTDDERYLLFANIAAIVNSHKIISIAGTIDQQQYREILKIDKRKQMSPYGLCYAICAIKNHHNANYNKYDKNIAFVLDDGCENSGHILTTHRVLKEWQKKEPYHMGSITFADDKNVPALQAADIIAWGVRKRLLKEPFDKGYNYIENIISENHVEEPWKTDDLQGLARRFMKYQDQNH